jgi:hypothetical protein
LQPTRIQPEIFEVSADRLTYPPVIAERELQARSVIGGTRMQRIDVRARQNRSLIAKHNTLCQRDSEKMVLPSLRRHDKGLASVARFVNPILNRKSVNPLKFAGFHVIHSRVWLLFGRLEGIAVQLARAVIRAGLSIGSQI